MQTDVTAAGRCNYELQHLSDCNHFVNLMEELRSAIIVCATVAIQSEDEFALILASTPACCAW